MAGARNVGGTSQSRWMTHGSTGDVAADWKVETASSSFLSFS